MSKPYEIREQLLSLDMIRVISKRLSQTLGRQCTALDVANLIEFIKNRAADRLQGTRQEIVDSIVRDFVKPRPVVPVAQSLLDPDVRMRLDISENENPYKYTAHTSRTTPKPETTIECLVPKLQTFSSIALPHLTLPLDSRYRDFSHNSAGEYRWNINISSHVGRLGDIHAQDSIQEIIKIKAYPFWMPYSRDVDIYYRKIRVLIKEFVQRSETIEFLDAGESQASVSGFHFEYDVAEISDGRVFLRPSNKEYVFHKPVARLESITLSFKTPFAVMNLPADRGIFSVIYGNPTVFTSSVAHGLTTGDLVYVLDLASVNSTINAAANSVAGWLVSVINPTDFSIALDSSALVGVAGGIHVNFGSKRIAPQFTLYMLEK